MATKAIQATVKGHVQGVGFRFATRRLAFSLDLDGWVRNLQDGSVEVRAQGESAALGVLVAFLHEGPFGAQVRSVKSVEAPTDLTLVGFQVRH